jgi:hypothetical protein
MLENGREISSFESFRFTFEYIQGQVDKFNALYGGKHPKVHNVFTTQGEFDPWLPFGVSEDINESSPTYVIPGEFEVS